MNIERPTTPWRGWMEKMWINDFDKNQILSIIWKGLIESVNGIILRVPGSWLEKLHGSDILPNGSKPQPLFKAI